MFSINPNTGDDCFCYIVEKIEMPTLISCNRVSGESGKVLWMSLGKNRTRAGARTSCGHFGGSSSCKSAEIINWSKNALHENFPQRRRPDSTGIKKKCIVTRTRDLHNRSLLYQQHQRRTAVSHETWLHAQPISGIFLMKCYEYLLARETEILDISNNGFLCCIFSWNHDHHL